MSEDQKEPLYFIDFSRMTTAEGNVREDEPPEEQRSPTDARAERWKDAEALHQWRTPEAEHYLLRRDGRLYHRATFPAQTIEPTHVHAVVDVILAEEILRLRSALAEKEARIETLRLSLDVIVKRFAGPGLRAEDADEASLMAADRIREQEAALAAAHEVVGDLVAIVAEYAPGFEPDLERASAALSAPALQSAARKDRLRREVIKWDMGISDKFDDRNASFEMILWMQAAQREALAALRAEEEKNA